MQCSTMPRIIRGNINQEFCSSSSSPKPLLDAWVSMSIEYTWWVFLLILFQPHLCSPGCSHRWYLVFCKGRPRNLWALNFSPPWKVPFYSSLQGPCNLILHYGQENLLISPIGLVTYPIITQCNFYRTQVNLGSDLWVRMSVRMSVCLSDTLLRLNWCDSGWWRYQLNTNW